MINTPNLVVLGDRLHRLSCETSDLWISPYQKESEEVRISIEAALEKKKAVELLREFLPEPGKTA